MEKINRKIEVEYKFLSIDDFMKMDVYDANYSGILFVFAEEYTDQIYSKIIINNWNLNKQYRFDTVKETLMFYVENMDIQTIDSYPDLLRALRLDIKNIYVIGDEDCYLI